MFGKMAFAKSERLEKKEKWARLPSVKLMKSPRGMHVSSITLSARIKTSMNVQKSCFDLKGFNAR